MSISEGPLTSIAFCWAIERRDGAGLALTSHDRDLTIDGRLYGSRIDFHEILDINVMILHQGLHRS